jgi:uncharacterized protein (TIGR00730 family)
MNGPTQQIISTRTPEASVCVYCASSRSAPAAYREAAARLGAVLAEHNLAIIYGGGAVGSMGALADGALSRGGRVVGILPRFMAELEWGHTGLSELEIVEDMRIRKHRMLTHSAAVVALPGGSGTLEELLEALTFKRLGLYLNPIVLVNTRGFYNSFTDLMSRCIDEHFMDERHRQMWQLVEEPEQVPAAIKSAPSWSPDARRFAAV